MVSSNVAIQAFINRREPVTLNKDDEIICSCVKRGSSKASVAYSDSVHPPHWLKKTASWARLLWPCFRHIDVSSLTEELKDTNISEKTGGLDAKPVNLYNLLSFEDNTPTGQDAWIYDQRKHIKLKNKLSDYQI